MIKYLKYLLFVLFISVCHIANGQVKLSDLPRHTGNQNNVWLYAADSSSIWSTKRISLKEIRDSIISGDSGLKIEHDPIWEAISLPDITALPTFPFGANKQAIVKDPRIGGVFHLLAKGVRVIDSAITYPSPDTSQVWVRDRSQSTAINAAWYLKADYNTTTGIGTDNKPLLVKLLQAASLARSGIITIFFPAGTYYFSDSIGIKQIVHFMGDGSSTAFYFASGKNGLVFNRFNTPVGTTNTGVSDNSEIDHIVFNQKTPIVGGNAIIMHAAVKVHDCGFNDWGGAAIYINAGATTGDNTRIRRVMMVNSGLNYTSVPTLTATSPTGSGATFTPVLGSPLASVTVTDSGRQYYNAPVARVGNYGNLVTEDNIEASGYGAEVLPYMGVDTIYITNQGSGYTPANTSINITGSTWGAVAQPAVLEAVVNEGGQIIAINVLDGGDGYNAGTGTQVVITDPTGTGAAAHAIVASNGSIASVVVDDGGDGYTNATVDVDIIGGSNQPPNAQATPIISAGNIIGATITRRGKGYLAASQIHVTIIGDGAGATATATMQVVGVLVTRLGNLYEGAPTIRFFGGLHNAGHSAEAIGVASTIKKVKRVIVNNAGTGYQSSNTTLAFSGGGATSQAIARVATYGDRLGNANRWMVKKLFIDNCANGIWTEGGDANAGHAEELKITNCRFYAVREGSFLGNGYSNCHTSTNLGAYMSTSNNSLGTKFDNCYSEGGQLPSVGIDPARIFGGDHGAGVVGSWRIPITTFSSSESGTSHRGTAEIALVGQTNSETIRIGGTIDAGGIMEFHNPIISGSDLGLRMFLGPSTGNLTYAYGDDPNNLSQRGMIITGPYTSSKFGTSNIKPYSFFAQRFYVGADTGTARRITNATSIPTSGEYGNGDLVLNRNPNNTNKVFGWLRITSGTNHVAGTDWLVLTSGSASTAPTSIWNQDTAWQDGTYYISGAGSKISNYNQNVWQTIPNSGLDIVTRNVNFWYAALNIYQSGNASGMHLSSSGANTGTISTGGWQVSATTYMPRALRMASQRQSIGEFIWYNGLSLTPNVETSLNQRMKLDSLGRLAIGNFDPTATLHLKAGTTTAGSGPLKFSMASSNLTGIEQGMMNFLNNSLTFDVSTTSRKRFVLTNNVIPTNGQIPVGNGADYTASTLTQGSGINIVNGVGTVTISAPLANGRFGIEDNTSTVNRDVDMQTHNITLRNANLGINTTNPTAQLQVGNPQIVSTFGNPRLAVQDFMYIANSAGTQNGGYLTFSASNDAQGQMYGYFSGRTARGTVMTPAVLQTGDTLLKVGAAQWRPNGWPSYNTGAMNIINDSLATANSAPTYIGFSTTPIGSVTNVERLRLKANGGIRFNAYGSGTFIGTAAKWLAVTATGDMIEMTPPTTGGGGTVTSVAASVPAAFNVSGSPITTSGTFNITMPGATTQYLRGNGTLSTLNTDVRTAISLTTTGTNGEATYNNTTGILNIPQYTGGGSGTVTSVGVSVPAAFNVSGSPITTSGTFNITGAGTTSQYIRGDGTLATLPTIPAQFNPIEGTGISLSGSYPNVTISSKMLVTSTTRDDLPDLAPGAFYDFAETVTGAAALDGVIVASTYTTNIQITGQVSATNTVTVRVTNQGPSTIGFSTNWPFKIYVMKE